MLLLIFMEKIIMESNIEKKEATYSNKLRADLTTSKQCSLLSVLLVDDDPIVRRAHTQLLERLSCRIDIACSGYQALEILSRDHQIVVLDIQMPGMNGIETAIKIRQQYKQQCMPIICVTANFSEDLKNKCKKIGFNTVLRKPINVNILQILFRRLVKNLNYKLANFDE